MDNDYASGGGRSFGRSGGGGGGYQGTPQRDEKSGGFRLHVGGIGDGLDEGQVREVFEKVRGFIILCFAALLSILLNMAAFPRLID